jgi:GntR family transcriptional regulator
MPRRGLLSTANPVPLYYQLELQLRRAVVSGAFGESGRLPTELGLARTYGVSRITVRGALERLEEDGLIVRRRGRGTYVNPDQRDSGRVRRDPSSLDYEGDLHRAGIQARVVVTGCESGVGPPEVLDALGLGPDTQVWRVRRRGFDGSAPLWLETRYYPLKFQEILTEALMETVAINGLLIRLGFPITGEQWQLAAGRPTPRQARLLKVDARFPVLRGEYTSWSGPVAIQWGQVTFRGDRYRMTFAFGGTDATVRRIGRLSRGMVPDAANRGREGT